VAINFPASPTSGATFTNNNTTWQYDGTAWNIVTSSSPINVPNSYGNFAVATQNTVTANTGGDTLTLIAGDNVSITTDPANDSVTINSTGGGGGGGGEANQNAFSTISVTGQNNIIADTTTDTFTLVGGAGITIETNDNTDTITITSTAASGNFSSLTDVSTANINISNIYEHAIVTYNITTVSTPSRAYVFQQHYADSNPTLYVLSGTTVAFNLANLGGHPFVILDNTLTPLNSNVIHIATNGTVSVNSAAQGKDSGVLYWRIPENITNNTSYAYECNVHPEMNGGITVKRLANI